jgi:SAM-dependent methyltransferase
MGLTVEIARFLIQACRPPAPFGSVLTLGRQHLSVSPERLRELLIAHACWPPRGGETEFATLMRDPATRFEGLARALGAANVAACDASPYEGASLTHDLNLPVPEVWQERFDAVVDSGTLEHVFNFPVAIANAMNMVKTGGCLLLFTPANNYFGHGFYQFSPELFYRVLSPENGFRLERMEARANVEAVSTLFGVPYPFFKTTPPYAVRDPRDIRQRVTLINDLPTLLFIQARKTARVPVLSQCPQQSDYLAQWTRSAVAPASAPAPSSSPIVAWLRQHLSEKTCRELIPALARFLDPFRWTRYRRRHSLANRQMYRRVDDRGRSP